MLCSQVEDPCSGMMWYVWAWLVPCVLGYLALNWIRRWIRINDIEKKYVTVLDAIPTSSP